MVTHVNKALMTLYSLPSCLCRPQLPCGSLPVRSLPRLGEAETCETITLLHPTFDLHRQADS